MPEQTEIPVSLDANTTIHVEADSESFAILLDFVTDAIPLEAIPHCFDHVTRALHVGE